MSLESLPFGKIVCIGSGDADRFLASVAILCGRPFLACRQSETH